MAALNISPAQVRTMLGRNNFLSALGSTKGALVQVNLTANTDLHTVEDFKNLVIRWWRRSQAGPASRPLVIRIPLPISRICRLGPARHASARRAARRRPGCAKGRSIPTRTDAGSEDRTVPQGGRGPAIRRGCARSRPVDDAILPTRSPETAGEGHRPPTCRAISPCPKHRPRPWQGRRAWVQSAESGRSAPSEPWCSCYRDWYTRLSGGAATGEVRRCRPKGLYPRGLVAPPANARSRCGSTMGVLARTTRKCCARSAPSSTRASMKEVLLVEAPDGFRGPRHGGADARWPADGRSLAGPADQQETFTFLELMISPDSWKRGPRRDATTSGARPPGAGGLL